MSEGPPKQPAQQEKIETLLEKPSIEVARESYIRLAEELTQNIEGFPFTGINTHSYSKLKAADEEFPGYTTPIDVLVERFRVHGMKVVFGKNPIKEVYILPGDSNNIEEDSIFPKHLEIAQNMDPKLKELILANTFD